MNRILWTIGHELKIPDMVRGENCHLYDSKGKRYVDLESGVWCVALGHCHPAVAKVLAERSRRLMHTGYCYADPVIGEAAADLLSLVAFDDGKCEFLCSGSEAVEFSIRVARTVTARTKLLAMTDSYFGAYGAAADRNNPEWVPFDWLSCSSCPSFENCDPACSKLAELPLGDIAGFLFEPGSSSGLVRFPPNKIVANIVRKVAENGGLLIVNEVTTGMGRTGDWFGYRHYSLNPDIIALGKGLGNGYPVSAAVVNERVATALADKRFKYSQSHQNDPLGASVAREVIRIMREEKFVERGARAGERLKRGLESLQKSHHEITDIRGRGLMLAVEFDAGEPGVPPFVQSELLKAGFIVVNRAVGNAIRLDPPLTIGDEDIDSFLAAFGKVLDSENYRKERK